MSAIELECDRLETTYRILRPRKDYLANRAYRRLVTARAAALNAWCDEKAEQHQRDEDLGRAA